MESEEKIPEPESVQEKSEETISEESSQEEKLDEPKKKKEFFIKTLIMGNYSLPMTYWIFYFVAHNTNSQAHRLALPRSIEYSHGGLYNGKKCLFI